jgi:hypothetical protein
MKANNRWGPRADGPSGQGHELESLGNPRLPADAEVCGSASFFGVPDSGAGHESAMLRNQLLRLTLDASADRLVAAVAALEGRPSEAADRTRDELRDLATKSEICRELRVSKQTFWRHCTKTNLRPAAVVGGMPRWSLRAVLATVKSAASEGGRS